MPKFPEGGITHMSEFFVCFAYGIAFRRLESNLFSFLHYTLAMHLPE